MTKIFLCTGSLVLSLLFISSLHSQVSEFPKMDLHVHLNYEGQSLADAAKVYAKVASISRDKGVTFGIAEDFISDNKRVNDSLIRDRVKLVKKNSLYLALQVSRRDWQNIFSSDALKEVDYILADAMIFQNKNGQMVRIWVPGAPLGGMVVTSTPDTLENKIISFL